MVAIPMKQEKQALLEAAKKAEEKRKQLMAANRAAARSLLLGISEVSYVTVSIKQR